MMNGHVVFEIGTFGESLNTYSALVGPGARVRIAMSSQITRSREGFATGATLVRFILKTKDVIIRDFIF